MSQGIANRIGNYLYADGAMRKRVINGTTYIVGIAGAYDAFGLIGSEHNGIFILDDTNKRVLTDRICEQSSGYYGPNQSQWDCLRDYMNAPAKQFLAMVQDSPRYRG